MRSVEVREEGIADLGWDRSERMAIGTMVDACAKTGAAPQGDPHLRIELEMDGGGLVRGIAREVLMDDRENRGMAIDPQP